MQRARTTASTRASLVWRPRDLAVRFIDPRGARALIDAEIVTAAA
jgi:hypothetical protein